MKRKSFLVIDDSAVMRQLTAMMLRKLGCPAVRQAREGAEAIDELHEQLADVVLTDIDMPGMNGLEFIARAKAEFPQLPIIVLSTRGQEAIRDKAISLGATAYLTKPFSGVKLVETLEGIFPDIQV